MGGSKGDAVRAFFMVPTGKIISNGNSIQI